MTKEEKKITITIGDTFQVKTESLSLIEQIGMLTVAIELAKKEIGITPPEPSLPPQD